MFCYNFCGFLSFKVRKMYWVYHFHFICMLIFICINVSIIPVLVTINWYLIGEMIALKNSRDERVNYQLLGV